MPKVTLKDNKSFQINMFGWKKLSSLNFYKFIFIGSFPSLWPLCMSCWSVGWMVTSKRIKAPIHYTISLILKTNEKQDLFFWHVLKKKLMSCDDASFAARQGFDLPWLMIAVCSSMIKAERFNTKSPKSTFDMFSVLWLHCIQLCRFDCM